MTPHRWFLPESPDVVGMLREQAAITVEGLAELVAWAAGDEEAAARLRACEHRADDHKRELRRALTTAFLTPLEPEDIFELSRGLDEVLNSAKNTVREAELMGSSPDDAMAAMARQLADGARQLEAAFARLRPEEADAATTAADAAVKSARNLEHTYRAAMSALIELEDLHVVTARRELYRRFARTGDEVIVVAERVWYAVLKQT
ncbi:DUF47 domain-containing protein [Capillimicrobium parvum]|uniref:DUF47 family protein n=1 Tax=Capillimicrobium parvum TaxID=2884022 RepID=A0A9E6XYV1_9ACTN|nr:DUF47 family protein [Capillimicrobium parvum]UGS36980.1 hypothetical protein DSM104329_03392 [Capillimicrobium parvum]